METNEKFAPQGAEVFKSPVTGEAQESEKHPSTPQEKGRDWLSNHSEEIKEGLFKILGLQSDLENTSDIVYSLIRGVVGSGTALLYAANTHPEIFQNDPSNSIATLIMMAGAAGAMIPSTVFHAIKEKIRGY